MQNAVIVGAGFHPWHNLAVEELLFEQQSSGVTLYLWQNQSTVVIGRHQNAWKECRTALLEDDGGTLARRPSGGGAVYHDLGNLNFTFIMPRSMYNVPRQLSVIQAAVKAFGIDAVFTGRNDLALAEDGAKFSGSAFRLTDSTAMHHGTLLVDVDMEKLGRYLAPSKEKLAAKGVESVRARVRNLHACSAAVTVDALKEAVIQAFIAEYGEADSLYENALPQERLNALSQKHASWDWRYGKTPAFDIELYHKFSWGEVTLQLSAKEGHISAAQCYSDAMDEAFVTQIAPALMGAPLRPEALAERMRQISAKEAEELAFYLAALSL